MFPVGSKVAVIASATKSKGANLRKGSLGYIANVGRIFNIGKSNGYPSAAMRVVPARICFTRFGFESKKRSELKFVALIFPTIAPKSLKNPEQYLQRLVVQASDHIQQIKQNFQNNGTNAKEITPVAVSFINSTQELTTDKNEFSSWFRSITMSSVLNDILFTIPSNPYRKTLSALTGDSSKTHNRLIRSLSKRRFADNFVDDLFKNQEEVHEWVFRLQRILQLNRMRKVEELRNKYQRPVMNNAIAFLDTWALNSLGLNNLTGLIPKRTMAHKTEESLALGWLKVYNKLTQKLI